MVRRNRLICTSRSLGAGVALAALLSACAGEVPIRESTIESSLPERTAAIVPGQTDRAAIRQMFGGPWLASHYWQFDLVRLSDKEVRALVAIVPLPIPVGVMSDDVRGYVLVGYDAGGRVSAFDKGVTHGENLSWRTPMSGVDTVLLNVGEMGFAVEMMKNTRSVLVSSTRRDEYLRSRRAQDQCTVLVGCVQNGCSSALIVDEGPQRSLSTPRRTAASVRRRNIGWRL